MDALREKLCSMLRNMCIYFYAKKGREKTKENNALLLLTIFVAYF